MGVGRNHAFDIKNNHTAKWSRRAVCILLGAQHFPLSYTQTLILLFINGVRQQDRFTWNQILGRFTVKKGTISPFMLVAFSNHAHRQQEEPHSADLKHSKLAEWVSKISGWLLKSHND